MATRKRKKPYYNAPQAKRKKPAWRKDLCPGMTGILITTNDQEKLCVSEAYNLLNEYADQLYGPESSSSTHASDSPAASDDEDIAATLAEEVRELRGSEHKPRRFQANISGAKHVVFIQCRPPVDPVKLVHHILSDVMKTQQHKSRFCQRLVPVSAVCRATPYDIQKEVLPVIAPHFHQDDDVWKFAVQYKARNNKDVIRDDIITALASLVTRNGDYSHTVDLSNPDLTVVVEIIKSYCCVSVVKDFNKLKKYNIHSIMESFEGDATKPDTEKSSRCCVQEDRESGEGDNGRQHSGSGVEDHELVADSGAVAQDCSDREGQSIHGKEDAPDEASGETQTGES